MQTPLLDGISKHAFTMTGGRNKLKPWGGTTADVGSEYEGNMGVSIGGWSLGSKAAKGLGLAGRGVARFAAPVSGIAEFGYGMTKGVSDARKRGHSYGKKLGQSDPFLASRL